VFDPSPRPTHRRAAIRDKCPDRLGSWWRDLRASGALRSLGLAALFCGIAIAIVMRREDVVPYRPGQYVPQDIISRVDFTYTDKLQLNKVREDVRNSQPRIYRQNGDVWADLEKNLIDLPTQLATAKHVDEVNASLRTSLDLDGNTGAFTEFVALASDPKEKQAYEAQVAEYVRTLAEKDLAIIPETEYHEEWSKVIRRHVVLPPHGEVGKDVLFPASASTPETRARHEELHEIFRNAATKAFPAGLKAARIASYTFNNLKPTYLLDQEATTAAQNRAVEQVPRSQAQIHYSANRVIVPKGTINERDWQILREEKLAFITALGTGAMKSKVGLAGMVVLITAALSWYIARYQPRIVRNAARVVGLGTLFVSMLLLPQLAAVGTGPLYLFGIAPTILVTMILAIAYEQRFAIGVSTMHAILVTAALDQGIGFFMIIWVGVLTTGFLLDEIRTRSKLIEIGGVAAMTMIATTIAAGALSLDPLKYIGQSCLYTGAAGLAVGFIVLGILPFIERSFRITTGMTLLEMADASHPLLRRLSIEAPGTYNHSLQVSTLCEAAADAIGANSLLTRVAALYHDVGKINKPDYFVENQTSGRNRHIHLTPNMSLHIIIGHVKDGMALAKEYNLPPVILPFIQQHHGTTLIEYFFDKARKLHHETDPSGPEVPESQYRYNGPKPKSKEIAILMMADAVESATRAEREPSSARIEEIVHGLAMKRLLDHQFDESDLTMRDLELIERALIKTLTGIYHGRISYPSQQKPPQAPPAAPPATGSGAAAGIVA
jgi:putative nucleotidyltransferase with HDIG domain